MKQNDDNINKDHVDNDTIEENNENGPVICLLVDDIALNLKVLAAMVKKANYNPVVVGSAEEALALLAECKINLILTDLWMPEMNGMEFAKVVRNNPKYNDIPIIAVTADTECENNFEMQYFDDIFVKPVSLETIQNRLRQYDLRS